MASFNLTFSRTKRLSRDVRYAMLHQVRFETPFLQAADYASKAPTLSSQDYRGGGAGKWKLIITTSLPALSLVSSALAALVIHLL
jgi:hypothetical protein